MKMKPIIVIIATILLVSVANGWCGESSARPDKIARGLAESAATGPVRVIVLLEVPESGGIKHTENIKSAASTVVSRMTGRAQTVRTYDHLPLVALEVADKDALAALGGMPEVRSIVPDHLRPPPKTIKESPQTKVPQVYPQNLDKIGAQQAWAAGYTGTGWYVAIPDSGVLTTHEMFAGKNIVEACFSATRNCPNGQATMYGSGAAKPYSSSYDGYEHGTHVSGIAVGNSGNLFGVAKDASLIAIQVYSIFTSRSVCSPSPVPCIESYDSDQLAALDYIYSLRTTYQIASVNLSLGGSAYSDQRLCDTDADNPSYKTAIDALRSAGIATVIASGNDGDCNAVDAPGCISSAISVGAVDDTDTEAPFNDWHYTMLKFLAPGVKIYSAIPDTPKSYEFLSGTSMSTPQVSGAWAILKQQHPQATVADIFSALTDTGQPVQTACIPHLNDYKPRIQVNAALTPSLVPVPAAPISFSYPPAASPTLNFAQAMPVGVGTIAGIGDQSTPQVLNLQVGFAQFAAPVDIYFAVSSQSVDPAHLYLFVSGNTLQPVEAGLIPWQNNIIGPINESLFGELPALTLLPGDYTLYLAVTPTGRLDAYYLWTTDFTR